MGPEAWSTPSWSARPASSATSAARPPCPSSRAWMKLRGKLIQDDKQDDLPAVRDDGAALRDRGQHLGRLPQGPGRLVPRGPARRSTAPSTRPKPSTSPAAPPPTSRTTSAWPPCACSTRPASTSPTSATRRTAAARRCSSPASGTSFAETHAARTSPTRSRRPAPTRSSTSCPACDMMWRHVYPEWAKKLGIDYDITAKHYSEIVAEKIAAGEFTFPKAKSGRQDSRRCHLARLLPHRPRLRRLRAAARADQGDPRRRVRGDGAQPRGGALLRQRADPDQGAAGGRRHRRRDGSRRPRRSAPRRCWRSAPAASSSSG